MNNNTIYEELPPNAPDIMEGIRSSGYTFESALADIIDNSITANATIIDLFFDPNNLSISILDNGIGMDYQGLKHAMTWGKDPTAIRKSNDLGRFGLGLKSASLSQCRVLTVVSKIDNQYNGRRWDLDYVKSTGKWSNIILDEAEIKLLPRFDELSKYKSGTLVIWQKFDKLKNASNNLTQSIENNLSSSFDYLSLIFHQLIEDGLKININKNPLPLLDPFLTKNSHTQKLQADPIKIIASNGTKTTISVTPYVLPHFKDMAQTEKEIIERLNKIKPGQGFYIYRNKRLIMWGTWFRLVGQNELRKNARVKVEIPNNIDDIWEIDLKKSQVIPPPIIKNKLLFYVNNSNLVSQNIYKKRTKTPAAEKGFTTVWSKVCNRDNDKFVINRDIPMLEQLAESLSETQKALLENLLIDIENNLPQYAVFTGIANNREIEEEDKEDMKQRLISTIGILHLNKEEKKAFVDKIFKTEPYCNQQDLKEEIMKRF